MLQVEGIVTPTWWDWVGFSVEVLTALATIALAFLVYRHEVRSKSSAHISQLVELVHYPINKALGVDAQNGRYAPWATYSAWESIVDNVPSHMLRRVGRPVKARLDELLQVGKGIRQTDNAVERAAREAMRRSIERNAPDAVRDRDWERVGFVVRGPNGEDRGVFGPGLMWKDELSVADFEADDCIVELRAPKVGVITEDVVPREKVRAIWLDIEQELKAHENAMAFRDSKRRACEIGRELQRLLPAEIAGLEASIR